MNRQNNSIEIVDVHSHIYPSPYLRHLEARTEIPKIIKRGDERLFTIFPMEVSNDSSSGRPMGKEFWDLNEKIAYMDQNGITRSVISLGNPWLNPIPTSEGDALASEVNLEFASYHSSFGGRLVGMGAIPASSVEAVIIELRKIAHTVGLVGASSGPKIAGYTFDDPALEPFWTELETLGLPLFVHPENGVAVNELQGYGLALPIGVAFPMETTVTIARLIFGGVLERHPLLHLIMAHGGGTAPYLGGRMDVVWRTDSKLQSTLPMPPSEYLRRLFYDGLLYQGPALNALVRLVGADHVLFGTDHPFNVADPQTNICAIHEEFGDTVTARKLLNANAGEMFKV